MSRARSLAFNSAVRFLTESAVLGFGVVSGVVVARSLGPEGKGTLATLAFLFGVIGQSTPLGIEESTIILVGQRRTSLQRAVSAAVPMMFLTTAVGIATLLAITYLQFGLSGAMASTASLACLLVPLVGLSFLCTGFLNSQEQIVRTSVARMISRGATLLFLVVSVAFGPLNLTRSVGAEALGTGIGAGLLIWWLVRQGISFRASWDLGFLRDAIPRGVEIQGGRVISNLADRVDLLFVLVIAGRAATGQYSVALTIGQLVSHATFAITFAMFPRLASIEDPEQALDLTKRACRFGSAAALTTAICLAAIVPVGIPMLFGEGFRPAVGPALLLIVGGLFWSSQLLLARAWAARGTTQLMIRSYGASLAVMLVLDSLLIPTIGITGAALASAIAPVIGTFVCIREYKKVLGPNLAIHDLIPRMSDFGALARLPSELFRAR